MKNKKILIFIIMLLIFTMLIPTFSMADSPFDDPNSYNPGNGQVGGKVTDKAKNVMNIIATVGIVISVIALIVIGVKYMMGSVEEKAEYKKTMIPYIIGIVLIVSTSAIVGIIYNMTQQVIE